MADWNAQLQEIRAIGIRLADENIALKDKVHVLEHQLHETLHELEATRSKYQILALSRNGRTDEASEELRQKINRYIRDIDQCLKLLSD